MLTDFGIRHAQDADGHKYAPLTRPVAPATAGCVIAIPQVGGLHHRYERRAA
jgi:hypothetical protein